MTPTAPSRAPTSLSATPCDPSLTPVNSVRSAHPPQPRQLRRLGSRGRRCRGTVRERARRTRSERRSAALAWTAALPVAPTELLAGSSPAAGDLLGRRARRRRVAFVDGRTWQRVAFPGSRICRR